MRCLRCDWRSDPEQPDMRAQLAEHADTAGHPICLVCRQSLKAEEPAVCEPCLTESRSLLAGIRVMWVELPEHLGQPGAMRYDQHVRLVLSGPGSSGGNPRRLTRSERQRPERWWLTGGTGPLSQSQLMDAERQRTGREHVVDNQRPDGTAIAQLLSGWEDDWRATAGEQVAIVDGGRGGVNATIRDAADYLERRARWAANEHESFPEYLSDLRQLHTQLERATGRDDRPERAEADCFECSGRLLRMRKDGQPCRHKDLPDWPSQYQWDAELGRHVLFRSAEDVRAEYAQTVLAWEAEHAVCLQGGLADAWVCGRCEAEYPWDRYLLALRGQLEQSASGWSLPEHVAHVLEVPAETVRSWAKRGMVATACLVTDKRLRVSYEEVAERVRRRREAEQRRHERAGQRAS